MIRKLLAALFFVCLLAPVCATAAPLDDLPGRDSSVTESADVSHASVTLDTRPTDAAPLGTSPMLASVGVIGVAGAVAGKSLLSFRPGDRVTYVDERGLAHNALVTHWWGDHGRAACNLTYSSPENPTGDTRINSVSRGDGSAPGRYWQPEGDPATAEASDPPTVIPPPPPVTGYRQLTPQDVALMNEAKAAFDAVGNVLAKIRYPNGTPDTVDWLGFPYDAEEALRNARHHAQTASMWTIRAITRPSSFA